MKQHKMSEGIVNSMKQHADVFRRTVNSYEATHRGVYGTVNSYDATHTGV